MTRDSAERATRSPHRRDRALASLIGLVVVASAGLWAGQSPLADTQRPPSDVRFGANAFELDGVALVADEMPVFVKQSPPILRPDYAGNVQLEIVYTGSVSQLRVFRSSGAPPVYFFDEFPRVQTDTIGGRTVSIFRPSWAMGEFLLRFGLAIDFEGGIGATLNIAPSTVPLLPNGFPVTADNFDIRAMSTTVSNVPVVQIDATAQYSSHIVNLVVPGLANSLGATDVPFPPGLVPYFQSYFGDDYDQLALVFREHPFCRGCSAGHAIGRNRISGIGLRLDDGGSPGRLEGIGFYLRGLNNHISNHELSHQWGHYFYWLGIAGIDQRSGATHDPLWGHLDSPLAAFLFGNLRLRPLGGVDWETELVPEPTQIPPLQAYAMGRLPASAVPPIDIFEDQNRVWTTVPGVRMSGTTRRVTIDQIIAYHGPRIGPTVTSVRQATILVSRDALATPEEMAYWTLLAQRLEDPYQTGMINEQGIGSFRSISGVPLYTGVIPPGGGPPLSGHTMLEPDVLDRRDLAGLELDTAPRLDVPYIGIFRMRGRIVDPRLAGATGIGVQFGGGTTLSANVATDGTFSINASPEMGIGRNFLRTFVLLDGGIQRTIARVRNVRFFRGPRVPPPPVALTATASGGNVSVQWSPDTGWPPTSYVLDAGSSPGAADIGSFPTTAPALSASSVPNGRYYLRVRAINATGASAPSAEAVLTVGCVPPLAPTMLTGVVNGTSVTLAWQASPTSGVSYTVVAGSAPGASNIAQVPVGTATTLTAAAPPGRYFVRARAVAPCGAAESNEVDLIVGGPQLPGAPGNLTHQVTGRTVNLSWQAAAGAVDGHVLEAGSQPALSNLAVVSLGNALSFSAPNVSPGTYYVRVRAFNAAGQGPPSNERTIVVP